ncbi:MAG: hypothetical protein WCJ17_00035 [bacterium]
MITKHIIALMCITIIGIQYAQPSSPPYSVEIRTEEESIAQNQKAKELLAFIFIDIDPAARLTEPEIYAAVWRHIDSILGTWYHQITKTKPDSTLTQRNEQVMFFIINALILHAHDTVEQAMARGTDVDCNNIDIKYYKATINLFLRVMYQTIMIKKRTRHRRHYRVRAEAYKHHICRLEWILCNMIDDLRPSDYDTTETSSESTDECGKIRPVSFGFESQLQRLIKNFPEYDFRTILSKYYNDGMDSEDPVLKAIPVFPDAVPFTMA